VALRSLALILTLVTLGSLPAQAQMSARDIVSKTDKDHRAKDEEGTVEMVLVTKDGRKQKRKMQMLFLQGKGENDKHRLRFLSPPNVSGMTLLTHEATGRSDDQWIYLPAFKKLKKIASSKRTNRFAQTDFTYEDLRTEDLGAFKYAKAGKAEVEGKDCFKIVATPKKPETSGYSKRVLYIEKARFLTFKIVYFDKKDRKQKTLTNKDFKKSSGFWRPRVSLMEDHQRSSKTAWRFTERKINKGMATSKFTPESLKRGM
jgi:hypothetical protein